MDPSLTNGESRSIVSVPDGAGQTDGSVHTEVHLLRQLQQGDVMLIARGLVLLVDMDTGHPHHPLGHTVGGDVVITQPHLHQQI